MKWLTAEKGVQKYGDFLNSIFELQNVIRELNPLYDSVLFCHFTDFLLGEIDRFNKHIFSEIGVQCHLILSENLKLKYQ